MWDKRAQFIKNYDGDTITMLLDQGFRDTKEIDVRLLGVYAPELREPGGNETRIFVYDWFQERMLAGVTWSFIVTTARMKVADREQKTLDRYVASVTTSWDLNDSLNAAVNEFIHENGYGGGTGS